MDIDYRETGEHFHEQFYEYTYDLDTIRAALEKHGFVLEKAMQCFPLTPKGKVCMDIGASTGGFTDCMPVSYTHLTTSIVPLTRFVLTTVPAVFARRPWSVPAAISGTGLASAASSSSRPS